MISHHADNLIKLAKKLDRLGKFNLSDKIDGFIKTSGGIVPQAFDYKPTDVDFGGSLLGNFFDPNSLKDSSLGYRIKGEQYAPGSAYMSQFGPNAPFVVPDELMLTPQKYAALVNSGRFDEIARIQSELGLLSLNYLKSSGANVQDLASLVSMWDNSANKNKKIVLENAVPTAVAKAIVDSLKSVSSTGARLNTSQLNGRILEVIYPMQSKHPNAARLLQQGVNQGVQAWMKELAYSNPNVVKNSVNTPEWKAFSSKYNLGNFDSRYRNLPPQSPSSLVKTTEQPKLDIPTTQPQDTE